MKLNSDGSLLAAGGTSKKIYLFGRGSPTPLWSYEANTWITKLDFNGEYIVAGTGLREYIGEGMREEKEFVCNEIIQPELPEYISGTKDSMLCKNFNGDEEGCTSRPEECFWVSEDSVCDAINAGNETNCADGSCDTAITGKGTKCGDGICERPEDKNNCCEDCRGKSYNGNSGGDEETGGRDIIINTTPENGGEKGGDDENASEEQSMEGDTVIDDVPESPEEEGIIEKIINFLKRLFL